MGLFAPRRSEIESGVVIIGAKLYKKLNTEEAKSKWSNPSRTWVSIFSVFAQKDLETINKYWPNVIKFQNRIELSFKELAAFYVFGTLQFGDNIFLNFNKLSEEDFIREVSEILDLTINHQNQIKKYAQNYGREAFKKFSNAPKFTKEISEKFSDFKFREVTDLLKSIADAVKDFSDIPLPNREIMEKLKEERSTHRTVFNDLLKSSGLLP